MTSHFRLKQPGVARYPPSPHGLLLSPRYGGGIPGRLTREQGMGLIRFVYAKIAKLILMDKCQGKTALSMKLDEEKENRIRLSDRGIPKW